MRGIIHPPGGKVLIAKKIIKAFKPLGNKKISTAEHAETAEHFLPKGWKRKLSYESFILSAFSWISAVGGSFLFWGMKIPFPESSADEDMRMNQEQAESAEILPGKALGSLGLQASVGNEATISIAPGHFAFCRFYLCVLCELCG